MQPSVELPERLMDVIAQNTRRLRSERGWSQEKLARKMEMSRDTVRSIELGVGMNVDTLDRLALAFGVGLGELLAKRVKRDGHSARLRSLPSLGPPITPKVPAAARVPSQGRVWVQET